MSYAEQISFPYPSRGIIGKLAQWARQTGKQAPVDEQPEDAEATGAINTDVAVDIAAGRQFSGYRTPAGISRGSVRRLHGIAEGISSTLPR